MGMEIQKKYFSRYREPYASLPNLATMQLNSYEWFIKHGLREILDEFSPIKDYTDKELSLEFLDYFVDEPRFDENHARINNLSYEAPLRIKTRLVNAGTGEKKEQEVFLRFFDNLYFKYQQQLNQINLQPARMTLTKTGLLELEIYKEGKLKKKVN